MSWDLRDDFFRVLLFRRGCLEGFWGGRFFMECLGIFIFVVFLYVLFRVVRFFVLYLGYLNVKV